MVLSKPLASCRETVSLVIRAQFPFLLSLGASYFVLYILGDSQTVFAVVVEHGIFISTPCMYMKAQSTENGIYSELIVRGTG